MKLVCHDSIAAVYLPSVMLLSDMTCFRNEHEFVVRTRAIESFYRLFQLQEPPLGLYLRSSV